MSIAIVTKYHASTATKGARISATSRCGRTYIGYHSSSGDDTSKHEQAAREHAIQHFWLPKPEACTFTVTCEPEDMSPDEQLEGESLTYVQEQIAAGHTWAWCCVRVRCESGELSGEDTLGGCSYASRKDFEACDYYADMKAQAYENMISGLLETATLPDGFSRVHVLRSKV